MGSIKRGIHNFTHTIKSWFPKTTARVRRAKAYASDQIESAREYARKRYIAARDYASESYDGAKRRTLGALNYAATERKRILGWGGAVPKRRKGKRGRTIKIRRA